MSNDRPPAVSGGGAAFYGQALPEDLQVAPAASGPSGSTGPGTIGPGSNVTQSGGGWAFAGDSGSGIVLTHTPGPGLTADLSIRGTTITVRDERLDAVEAGYLVQGSAADQHTGLQAFLNTIGTAVGGAGGSGFIPSGVYHMGNGTVTYPAGVTCGVTGELPPPGYGLGIYGLGGTELIWDSDVAGPPHTTYGITLGGSSQPHTLERMTLQGPQPYGSQNGGLMCALGGVNARRSAQLQDLNIVIFSTGVGWGGPGAGFDHCSPQNLRVGYVGYPFNFLPGSNSAGDFNARSCNLSGNLAAIGVAQSASSGLAGTSWVGCGLYGPIGIHRYSDGSSAQGDFVDSAQFVGTSFESNGVAAIYDELWQNFGQGANIENSFFSSGVAYQAPSTSQTQWSKTFSVAASAGTSLTLTDGSGWVFRPGMTVTGSGVPAGTVVTAVAGSWPWATVVLTVNNSVTGPTSVVVSMPLLAAWVALFIQNNEVVGNAISGATGYPLFMCQGLIRNRVRDAGAMLTVAQAGPIAAGSVTNGGFPAYGNVWGAAGDVGCPVMGSAQPASTLLAGDVLMTRSGYQGQAMRCDGSRRPIGVAIRASNASTNGDVDYLIRASATTTIPVQNKAATAIAAGALVKVDTANPGGVTTAASPNDGWVIGVNGTAAIAATSAGTLAELWI